MYERFLSNMVAIAMLLFIVLIFAAEINGGFSDGYLVPMVGIALLLLPGLIVMWLLLHLSRD